MALDPVEQVSQAVSELPRSGKGRELALDRVGAFIGCGPSSSRGLKRGEANRIGLDRGVGPSGGLSVETGLAQDIKHFLHANHGSRRDHGMAEVHVENGWLGYQEIAQATGRLGGPFPPIAPTGTRSPGFGQQSVGHLIEEVVFASDVAIQGHWRDSKSSGQAPDRHPFVAVNLYCPNRSIDHLIARDGPPGRSLAGLWIGALNP